MLKKIEELPDGEFTIKFIEWGPGGRHHYLLKDSNIDFLDLFYDHAIFLNLKVVVGDAIKKNGKNGTTEITIIQKRSQGRVETKIK